MKAIQAITPASADPILCRSTFFKRCLAERDAINRHRRRLATRRAEEITFDEALVDWTVRKRAKWLTRQRRIEG
jgi:hypothetical protein